MRADGGGHQGVDRDRLDWWSAQAGDGDLDARVARLMPHIEALFDQHLGPPTPPTRDPRRRWRHRPGRRHAPRSEQL